MNPFYLDIQQQPDVLRQLIAHHRTLGLGVHRTRLGRPNRVLLTGMGASYHVALWASILLQQLDTWAVAVESSDLVHFSSILLNEVDQVVFVSQSGSSAEIKPFVELLPSPVKLIAITNNPESPLATRADIVLTLEAGDESTVACKTYINSLACAWLLAHEWLHDVPDDRESLALLHLADRMTEILADSAKIADFWLQQLGTVKHLFFLGHGPHLPTARQSAMMLGEWAKQPAIGTSIGAFQHGLIEIVDSNTGVVILGLGGATDASAKSLAGELRSYGATVLTVIEGNTIHPNSDEPLTREFDEMLGSLLDVVPAQLFAEALARHLEITPGFRYIEKVVKRL